jgi:hypothetical protein
VSPIAILEIKEIASLVTEKQILLLGEKALGMDSATEIERLLEEAYPGTQSV